MTTDINHSYNLTDDAIKVAVEGEDGELGEKAEYVANRLREVASQPLELLAREGVPEAARGMRLSIDMRYTGQILEPNMPVPGEALEHGFDAEVLSTLCCGWMERYVRVYGDGAAWQGARSS